MSYRLIFTDQYTKRAARFLKRHPDLEKQYLKTLQLLELNPHHPSLRLHPLQGRLAALHSIAISMQYRITIELEVREQEIVLVNVGSHAEIY